MGERLPQQHPSRVLKTARSFTEVWDAISPAISDYPADQQRLYRLAHYAGAWHVLNFLKDNPTHRTRVLEETQSFLDTMQINISLPPSRGRVLAMWTQFATSPLYQTPSEPRLRDLYRSTFYNGVMIAMTLVNRLSRASIMRELDAYLETCPEWHHGDLR